MKKILISLITIAGVSVLAIGASGAFFSDTETSEGNTFVAGAIDLMVDFEGYYNKAVDDNPNAGSWTLQDLTESHKFFDFTDLKPGDFGEGTISLHVQDNDAYACVSIEPTLNDDISSTEPELEVDSENTDSIFDGELAQNMSFMIWADVCSTNAEPGDNIYQANCDKLLTEGDGPINPVTWTLADPSGNVFTDNGPLIGTEDYYLGIAWSIPNSVGNIIQTDKYMADISFYVEQARNNESFVCPSATPPAQTLRLENEEVVENGPWIVLSDDQIYADLTWTGDGPTFDYDLVAKGLASNTEYSLIYYADGWPGNNPGAFIKQHTTDVNGDFSDLSNSVNLNLNLPDPADGNYAIGAKIWLVKSSDYNGGSLTTGPMTNWQPGEYLFEGNVYITYDDTDV